MPEQIAIPQSEMRKKYLYLICHGEGEQFESKKKKGEKNPYNQQLKEAEVSYISEGRKR